MKRILVACGIFGVGTLLQLISSTVFLFSQLEPMKKTCILAGLLLISAFGLILLDWFLNRLNESECLNDDFKGLVFHGNRLAGMLLTIETLNVVVMAVASLFSVPFWLHAVLVLLLVLACIVSAGVVLKATQREETEEVAEQ